jgi:superkiller protein 3
LDEKNWFAKYMLANVGRELGEYELACEGYRAVLSLRPQEFGVLVALSETLIAMAWKYVETGYYGRAVDGVVECVSVMEKVLQQRTDAFNLWKTLGDACLIFSWVQRLADRFPRSSILRLLESDLEPSEFDIMADVDKIGPSTFENIKRGDLDDVTTSLYAGILAYKRAISATADDRHAHAVAWYNLGAAEYRAYAVLPKSEMKSRLAAIRCFKRTIKLEPGNHEFWNALGSATAELNPKVAQHSLVRALYINEKVSHRHQIKNASTNLRRTPACGPILGRFTPSKKTICSRMKHSREHKVPIRSTLWLG